ncbi:CG2144 [Drosophila busckii]|uniref:CG2144 n=1 Tax=Drosophila busckii TaxID=30019 RepID=A0A0M4EUM0_DROBS|nr:GPI ethanolamine phosphate transferase 2 [Drosophila busckii]ALC41157.1 CG2144 [Drosophila busckii]
MADCNPAEPKNTICLRLTVAVGSCDVEEDVSEMEEHKSRLAYTFYMLTLFLFGCVLFIVGFFPASYTTTDAERESTIPNGWPIKMYGKKITPPPASYDAFVLFLIDALRDDFPTETNMPVSYEKACIKLNLHVDIPTVTMPRLKSMTTGTLSNFIDIALNVGSIEQLEDSLLHRLRDRDAVVSFAGDHTWLKLFPSEFTRAAANNDSFYVNDFYNGDKLVTSALEEELEKADWKLLILHYLGLDHIGHVEGNESPKIPHKLREMDQAVQKIIEHKNMQNYLMLLTGDHGMADGGGHGGNTPAETSVPLYLFSKNCSKPTTVTKRYNQIDLAPTLAVLLSVEIPTMSIGCLIPEMLQSLTLEQQLYAYFYNAHHLLNRARVKFGHEVVHRSDYYHWYQNATLLHKDLLDPLREGDGSSASQVHYQNAKLNYMRVAREISGLLSESLVKFDYGFIAMGLVLTTAAALHLALSVLFTDVANEQLQLQSLKKAQLLLSLVIGATLNIFAHALDVIMTSTLLLKLILMLLLVAAIYLSFDVVLTFIKIALPPIYTRRLKISIPLPVPLLVCFAIRVLTLGSSSFIEFEYLTWYYLGNTLLLLTTFRTLRRRITKANEELDGRHLYKIASVCLWQQRKIFVVLLLLILMRHTYGLQAIKSTLMVFALMLFWARLRKFHTNLQAIFCGIAFLLVYTFRGLNQQVQFFTLSEQLAARLVLPVLVLFWCCFALVLVLGYRAALPQQQSSTDLLNLEARPTSALLRLLQTNLSCSLILTALMFKVQNIVLLPTLLITLDETYKLCEAYGTSARKFSVRLVHVYKIIMTIFVGRMFFFYQGNSNSLSTIDLTPGYIGQTSYDPNVVSIFVSLNTFSADIHSFLYLIVHTLRANLKSVGIMQLQPPYAKAADTLVAPLYAALLLLPVAFYLCLMLGFRYHLFIYSVFSPKVVYDCYTVFVFFFVFLITSLYFKLFKNDA